MKISNRDVEAAPNRGVSRLAMIAVVVAVLAAVLAGATMWLLISDPVDVANFVDTGDYSPLVKQLAEAIYNAIASLLNYL